MSTGDDRWEPLESRLGTERCAGFMFMGRLPNGINQYKHEISRRYLFLDDAARMNELTTEASVESGQQMRSPECRSRSGRWAKHSKHLTTTNISAEKMTLCGLRVSKCFESISGGRFEEYTRSPLMW